MNRKQKKVLFRIILTVLLVVGLIVSENFFEMNPYLTLVLYLIPYLVIGYDVKGEVVQRTRCFEKGDKRNFKETGLR